MAIARWGTPGPRSSNLAGTTLNNLVNGASSTRVVYENTTGKAYNAFLTIKLGSITPATGGSISARITCSDGVDVGDGINGDSWPLALTTTTSAKVVIKEMIRIYPGTNRINITNNSGTSFPSSGNEIYITPYGEEIV